MVAIFLTELSFLLVSVSLAEKSRFSSVEDVPWVIFVWSLLSTTRWDYSLWPSCCIDSFETAWVDLLKYQRFGLSKFRNHFEPRDIHEIRLGLQWAIYKEKFYVKKWKAKRFRHYVIIRVNDGNLENDDITKYLVFTFQIYFALYIAHFEVTREKFHEQTNIWDTLFFSWSAVYCNQHIQCCDVFISIERGCS